MTPYAALKLVSTKLILLVIILSMSIGSILNLFSLWYFVHLSGNITRKIDLVWGRQKCIINSFSKITYYKMSLKELIILSNFLVIALVQKELKRFSRSRDFKMMTSSVGLNLILNQFVFLNNHFVQIWWS